MCICSVSKLRVIVCCYLIHDPESTDNGLSQHFTHSNLLTRCFLCQQIIQHPSAEQTELFPQCLQDDRHRYLSLRDHTGSEGALLYTSYIKWCG